MKMILISQCSQCPYKDTNTYISHCSIGLVTDENYTGCFVPSDLLNKYEIKDLETVQDFCPLRDYND